ncbi:A/G-specific adenine glycosylase [Oscillibacter valericigenes Sjm18-20]|nr:A/G-specific adenine glycosylase [Oscillibacter valericigenes Sjm18-20]
MPHTPLTTLSEIVSPLLSWYRANARDLPWRKTRDPYRVWVSEIMLQQTRVAAVLGYYQRFLSAFPSVEALADAPEERLMKLWEGLGYYNRARNLRSAAQTVVKVFGGKFPDTYEGLLALPGVGDYTASAVASASFGRREPAVDGNVLRVFTRLTDCHDDIGDPKTKRTVRERIESIMPIEPEDIRVFNQALMELGAVVCAPGGPPKCGTCPLAEKCLGRRRGTAESLPVKSPKKARRTEEKTVFLFFRDGKVALRKRPRDGLLAGLWEFPNADGAMDETAAGVQAALWGLTPGAWKRRLTAKHIFSHVEWHMTGYVLKVSGDGPEDFFWADRPELEKRAIPSAFARFLNETKTILSENDTGGNLEGGSLSWA